MTAFLKGKVYGRFENRGYATTLPPLDAALPGPMSIGTRCGKLPRSRLRGTVLPTASSCFLFFGLPQVLTRYIL